MGKKAEEVKLMSFEKKQLWLNEQCEKQRIPWTNGADWIRIHMDHRLLVKSLKCLHNCNLHKVGYYTASSFP